MFQAKPTTYTLEHDQVLFATSWLKDNALRHWTALLQNNPNHPALHQWGVYIKENTNTAQRTTLTDKPSTMTSPNTPRGPLTQEEQEECQ